MNILLCGFGKCGARMVLDFHCLIYGGKNSYELRIQKSHTVPGRGLINWLKDRFDYFSAWGTEVIPEKDRPLLHIGDSDPDNEITAGYLESQAEEKDHNKHLKRLIENKVEFTNHNEACGQYHSIGEMVMDNLLKTNEHAQLQLLQVPIKDRGCYICCFSLGGGTGCGVSSSLIAHVNELAKEKHRTIFTAGIVILPESDMEETNYYISAGRFLTKFFAAKYDEQQNSKMNLTVFDSVITLSNSIITRIGQDKAEAEAKVNTFASNLVCSLINSSSRFLRSTRNPDPPELKKNLTHLAFFCYSEVKPESEKDITLTLFEKAISPITLQGEGTRRSSTFEGISIDVTDPKYYPMEEYEKLLMKLKNLKSTGSQFQESLNQLIQEPSQELPLPFRSSRKITVLYGTPRDSKSTSVSQSDLKSLIKIFFPNAEIDFYQTYHPQTHETLTLIPSGYLSYEILNLVREYLTSVWEWKRDEPEQDQENFFFRLLKGEEITLDEIKELIGDQENFNLKFKDYSRFEENIKSKFGMTDDEVAKYHLKSEDVCKCCQYVRDIINFLKKPKVVRPKIEFIRL